MDAWFEHPRHLDGELAEDGGSIDQELRWRSQDDGARKVAAVSVKIPAAITIAVPVHQDGHSVGTLGLSFFAYGLTSDKAVSCYQAQLIDLAAAHSEG